MRIPLPGCCHADDVNVHAVDSARRTSGSPGGSAAVWASTSQVLDLSELATQRADRLFAR